MQSFGPMGRKTRTASEECHRTIIPQWHRTIRFLLSSLLHIGNLVLRAWSIMIYFDQRAYGVVALQGALEVVGALLSIRVTFKDADVQRLLQTGPCLMRVAFGLLSVIVLGLCQVIHVKRAWARQLRVAEILGSLDGQDFLWTGPALGAERTLPVALITGVPFSMVTSYAFLTLKHADIETYVLGCASVSTLCVVSLGVIEVDVAVSAFVAKRYHFDPSQRGSRSGGMQWLYPAFHAAYRISEVVMRVTMLTLFVFILASSDVHGKALGLALIGFDFVIGVAVLRLFSPAAERGVVHILVGVGLILANVMQFVDRPGFTYPARLISRVIECWRLAQLAVFALICAIVVNRRPTDECVQCHHLRLNRASLVLLAALGAHAILRLSTLLFKMGDDLHTAALSGNVGRVRKLLDVGPGGEMLDVNGRMKDTTRATPMMLAAQVGNVEVLRLLVTAGGRVALKNARAETCIHYAVRRLRIDALDYLVDQHGARGVLRLHGEALRDLAQRRSKRLDQGLRARLLELLQPRLRPTTPMPGAAAQTYNLASVKTQHARGRKLNDLFPDAIQEEVPPMGQLLSVSALVFAHAAGPLARCVLTPLSEPSDSASAGGVVTLESLRRVRVLGQGASAHVIEVEVQEDRHRVASINSQSVISSFINRVRSERPVRSNNSQTISYLSTPSGAFDSSVEPVGRFALKLQAKTHFQAECQAFSEVLALQRASHPFIVQMEQAFQTPQFFALLLELCPGGDLNRTLCTTRDEEGRYSGLSPRRCGRFGGQALLALVHLHETVGIVYRDVKPENILISARDEAKLTDFGLAVYVGASKLKRMSMKGTAGFLAPELVFGIDGSDDDNEDLNSEDRVDPFKTDAYSFGVTLEVMLLGEDCAVRREDSHGNMWMLPRGGSERESLKLLEQAKASGRLSPEAYHLLHGLTAYKPGRRQCLTDEDVRNHAFWLKNLGCQDLAEYLLPLPENALPAADSSISSV